MICDFCHEREASVFIEMHGPDSKKKICLCPECAAKFGVNHDPRSLNSLITELSKNIKSAADEDNIVCPVCGTSRQHIKKSGRAGCPECYSIFKDDIKAVLKKNGSSGSYTGMLPARLASFKSVLTDRIILREKLEESLKREDYEKAAVYRDYLKALEKSPVAGDCDE